MAKYFGSKGPRGDAGAAGAPGAKGDTGDTGAQGDQGIQGIQGIQGVQGVPGDFNYTDRGALGAYDYILTDLTRNGTWQALDLSSIIGEAARLVFLSVLLKADAAEKLFEVKNPIGGNDYGRSHVFTQTAGVFTAGDLWVYSNSSGVINYWFDNPNGFTWTNFFMAVRGWVE